jgi:FlaA1/EpsC-like NDP-sugar epimerase
MEKWKNRLFDFLKNLTHDFVERYTNRSIPRWLIFFLDLSIVSIVYLLICVVRTSSIIPSFVDNAIYEWVVLLMIYSCSFIVTKSYHGIIRHIGLKDILLILQDSVFVFILYQLIKLSGRYIEAVKPLLLRNSEMFFLIAVVAVGMILMRFSIKYLYQVLFVSPQAERKNILIYGAGVCGITVKGVLRQDLHNDYRIIGYVDDNPALWGMQVDTIMIYPPHEALTEVFTSQHNITTLILAISKISVAKKQEIINLAMNYGITMKIVPSAERWVNGSLSSKQLLDIKIEDLLEREPIVLDNQNVYKELQGKVVLVTGAAGSIGSEIARQVATFQPKKLVLLDMAESALYDLQFDMRNDPNLIDMVADMHFIVASVKDTLRMEEVFKTYRPEVVYHAAAYKHVPFMEDFPYEAVAVNVFGSKLLADLSVKYEVSKFVMISTDKAVNPTNVMGATKRVAEIYIQSLNKRNTKFITTRFGNVLGSNGSVIPLFKKQLEKGGPLTITDKNIIRYFMTIPEACSLVLEAGAMGDGGDIFVFDMGEPVKIYDLALNMIKLSHAENIEIKEIGLRPGEKLYEELLATKENTLPTHHPKIMRAQVRTYDRQIVLQAYAELKEALVSGDEFEIVKKIKQIVPEYISNNSRFSALDNKKE